MAAASVCDGAGGLLRQIDTAWGQALCHHHLPSRQAKRTLAKAGRLHQSASSVSLGARCCAVAQRDIACQASASGRVAHPGIATLGSDLFTSAESIDNDDSIDSLGFPGNFQDKYELQERIGKGAWSTVHRGRHKATGEEVAVKVLQKIRVPAGGLDPSFVRRIRREVATHHALSGSPYVCHMKGAFEEPEVLYIVTELCTGGQLWERVQAGRFTEATAAIIVREVLELLAQAHSVGLVLRDIKLDNLLFLTDDDDAPVKAIDFGIATRCDTDELLHERCGSPVFVAPEVLQKAYGQKADIWSAGIVAFMLLTARLPWHSDNPITTADLYEDMGDGKSFTRKDAFAALMFEEVDVDALKRQGLSADAQDFISRVLVKDPKNRLTAAEALKHRWLAQRQPA